MACDPARFIGNQEGHEDYRVGVNRALSMIGKAVGPDGKTIEVKTARTVSEAQLRAAELRETMSGRGSHPDVIRFCRAELIQDNYFHAVLEAVKSMAQKIRDKTQLDGDGADLVTRAFGTSEPLWVINDYRNEGHKKEQTGFCNLLIGIFGMFRNPLAHEPKIYWEMKREDAEDLLSMLSLIHRRIDSAYMRPRV